MNNNSRNPIIWSLCVVIGIAIGTYITSSFQSERYRFDATGCDKVSYLLQLVNSNYVDTVDIDSLIEVAIPKLISELDPHSGYIPAKDAEQANEDLKGSFSGIGVTFRVENDSVTVMSVVRGGPAEKVGILAGDRIITADTVSLCKMGSTQVMKHLKGEKGSQVRLEIVRHGSKAPIPFIVERGDIPIESIDASFLIDGNIGYIRIKSFGEQTYAEMLQALAGMHTNGMRSLIIDLRDNRGGYMHTAIQIANEFLPKDRLIVYTEGRRVGRSEYKSNGRGSFQHLPLVVLIDEMSASSSEILAGAIQDNDRGTIIGRRSFGKGLVQQPVEFSDGSEVRLTVARYHTPSGRCIQKPYEKGHGEDYENELLMRYQRGEFYIEDSIRQDGPKYHTTIGRTVYGGGGIRPDIFIPEDTTGITSYYKEAVYRGLIAQFSFEVVDQNRHTLTSLPTLEEKVKWLDKQNVLESFARYAQKRSLPRRNLMMHKSRNLFIRALYSSIIYNCSEMSDYLRYMNQDDPVVQRSLQIIRQGQTIPVMPQPATPNDSITCEQ